jgi:hypothetical protein
MSAMPFPPLGRAMPFRGALVGKGRESPADPARMEADMFAAGQQDEVAGLIIGAVLIVMMDMEAIRNRATVGSLPHHAMKAVAITLKILATEVVAPPPELLDGRRYDLDAHDLCPMRCDTAS